MTLSEKYLDMVGKYFRFVLAALMIVAASSCSEDGLFSKDSKASIKVKSIDLSGARSLMVMKAPGGATTKADEQQEYVDRLFKVDGNGNVSVAVFTFESEGLKKEMGGGRVRITARPLAYGGPGQRIYPSRKRLPVTARIVQQSGEKRKASPGAGPRCMVISPQTFGRSTVPA